MKTFSLLYRNFVFSIFTRKHGRFNDLGGIDDSLENEFKISDYE